MKAVEFASQICTTREQSERLLSLGLKKETADMWYPHFAKTCPLPLVDEVLNSDDLPAWSFARLLEIFLTTGGYRNILFVSKGDHMAYLVEQIRRYILEGFLDKRFLED